jgi:CHAD domain-containing protein
MRVAKEWEIPNLSGDESFKSAAAKIIKTKSDEMWSYAPGTIAGEDIEELHSMRVSSRRLRAAVDVCAPCFPTRSYRRYQRVVSELTGELGGVRDSDVMLDFLKG